ncbi:MAG TPA: hypothetical protein VML75_23650 [Kofleriaceae bacterium]|nr:hypothetical protein [Kofleriaceae bacterium]
MSKACFPSPALAARSRGALLAIAVAALCAPESRARADGPLATPAASAGRPHAVYLELLGKGGLWGLGYDYQLDRWLGAGVVASFYVVDGQRVAGVSPYLAGYPLSRDRHRGFVHLGPQLFHVSTPSPVPEWSGVASTGLGAEVSAGYEYRDRVLVRVYAMASAGAEGVAPWLGASLGWTF